MPEQPKFIGELVIVALKAKELPNREIVGKQDPFCVFRLGEVAKRTKTDYRGGQRPVWDDQVNIPVPPNKTKVYVQVFDEDSSREDLISEGEVDLTAVLRDGEVDGWYPLFYKGKPAGQIYLELTFYSARPPPKRQPTRYSKPLRHNHNSYLATNQPPPVPVPSKSTPVQSNDPCPPFYIAPRPEVHEQLATPHMPTPLGPSTSTGSTGSAGQSRPRPASHGGYPPMAPSQSTGTASSVGSHPGMTGGYPPIPANSGYPPYPRPSSSTPFMLKPSVSTGTTNSSTGRYRPPVVFNAPQQPYPPVAPYPYQPSNTSGAPFAEPPRPHSAEYRPYPGAPPYPSAQQAYPPYGNNTQRPPGQPGFGPAPPSRYPPQYH